jgi:hypothetical protein
MTGQRTLRTHIPHGCDHSHRRSLVVALAMEVMPPEAIAGCSIQQLQLHCWECVRRILAEPVSDERGQVGGDEVSRQGPRQSCRQQLIDQSCA